MNTGNMVILKMSKKIGVIAEDSSDISVVNEILMKYMDCNEYSIKKFVGNGCGKLRNKCGAWAKMLSKSGCEHILVLHDLDRNDKSHLIDELSKKVSKDIYPSSIIIIPVEELEAWLLTDAKAIKNVFNLKRAPKKINNSETIDSPKEHLRDLVWHLGRKRYLNTTHNQKIANKSSVTNFLRCKSYKPLDKYIREELCV